MTTFLEIERGDDEQYAMTVLDEAQQPTSVAGAYLTFTIKSSISDSDEDALIQKTIGNGITVVDEPTGEIILTIDAADTDDLGGDLKGLPWDLQITTAAGKTRTLDKGTVNIVADVTRTRP